MRKRVYIAGPISKGDLCHNVNQATAAFVAIAKAGFAPFAPQWSVYSKPCKSRQLAPFEGGGWAVSCLGTVTGNDQMSHADWMGVDLPWVAVSDAVLRLPGESTGADVETAYAEAHGIPVLHSVAAVIAMFPEPDLTLPV